jgi:hypothetical protein
MIEPRTQLPTLARSPISQRATDNPLRAMSQATPQPVAPPPITATSAYTGSRYFEVITHTPFQPAPGGLAMSSAHFSAYAAEAGSADAFPEKISFASANLPA